MFYIKKKLFIIIFILLLTLLIIFIPKNKKENNLIKLAEVTHSIFYTPLYVAIENNIFKDNGLDIDLILVSGADKVSSAVISGDVQIGLAGAESALYVFDKGNTDYLEIFSGLTKRDGQFIVAREKIDNFTLKDLYGKEILVGRSTGMPALNFLNALKKNGIDKDKININYSVDFASLSGSFIGGTGDYVNLFEPNASTLENSNYGYVVASVGLLSGEMPYTTFYAKKSYIENNKEIINKFQKSINEALTFVKENDEVTIASVIKNQFPDTDINELASLIKRYKDADSYLDSYEIPKEYLDNLEDLLLDNNLISKYIEYNDIIVNN